MNKLSNWLTYGLFVLGGVKCNAVRGAGSVSSYLSAASSLFLKRALSPGTLIAGMVGFAATSTSKIDLDEMQIGVLIGSIVTTYCEAFWRIGLCNELKSKDQNQQLAQFIKLAVSVYGSHVFAMISGSALRQLFNAYTNHDPRARLALTCFGALLATSVYPEVRS